MVGTAAVVDRAGVTEAARSTKCSVLVDDVHRAGGIRDAAGEGRVDGEGAGELVDGEPVLDRERDGQDELGCARRDDHATDHGARPRPANSFTNPSLRPIIFARGLDASGSL